MFHGIESNGKNSRRPETRGEDDSKRETHYNGYKLRRSCSVYKCGKPVQMKDLCSQHLKEVEEQQQSPIHMSFDDFLSTDESNSSSDRREDLDKNISHNQGKVFIKASNSGE